MPAGWRCRAASSSEDEDIDAAAYRELEEEAGVGPEDVVLEQLRTYGRPDRDPRGRVVTVAWLAMGANLPDPSAGSDAAEAMWVPVERRSQAASRSPSTTGTSCATVSSAPGPSSSTQVSERPSAGPSSRSRNCAASTRPFGGEPLDKANFHRKVTGAEGFLRPTGEYTRSGRGRPARLFVADPASMLRPPIMRVEASD